MKKRILFITLSLILLFSSFPMTAVMIEPAFMQDVSVEIDGVRVDFPDQHPMIIDNVPFIPIRNVFEKLGFEVQWESYAAQTVTLSRAVHAIHITIGSAYFTVNDESFELSTPAKLIGGRAMLNPGVVLENLGYLSVWDETTNTLYISSGTVSTLYHQSGIPAWLIAGLTVYRTGSNRAGVDINVDVAGWYSDVNSRGLPALCDQWFIPGFIDDPLGEYVTSVAAAFVLYLSETGVLDELISLYRRVISPWYAAERWSASQAREAERIRAGLWAEFVGADVNAQDVIFQYTFGDSQALTGLGSMGVSFNALAQYGWYFFSASDWTRDIAAHYIEVGEESMQFVGNRLGYFPEEPIISVFKAPPYDFGLALFGAGGRYWADAGKYRTIDSRGAIGDSLVLSVHVHEVTHALLELAPHISRSNVPSPPDRFIYRFVFEDYYSGFEFGQLAFEEGLCVLFQHLFLIYSENDRFAAEYAARRVFPNLAILDMDIGEYEDILLQEAPFYIAYNTAGGFDTFEDFVAFLEDYLLVGDEFSEFGDYDMIQTYPLRRATRDEVVTLAHFQGFERLLHGFNMFMGIFDFQGAVDYGVPYAVLFDHYTGASFFLYILENRGTMEDLLRVYQDINLMVDMFGVDLEGMIDEWLAYLDDRFEEWGQMMTSIRESEVSMWFDEFILRYEQWYMQWMMQMQEQVG